MALYGKRLQTVELGGWESSGLLYVQQVESIQLGTLHCYTDTAALLNKYFAKPDTANNVASEV